MNFILFLSEFMIPFLVFYVVGYGLLMKKNVYDDFVRGAKDGMHTVAGILPTLVGFSLGAALCLLCKNVFLLGGHRAGA